MPEEEGGCQAETKWDSALSSQRTVLVFLRANETHHPWSFAVMPSVGTTVHTWPAKEVDVKMTGVMNSSLLGSSSEPSPFPYHTAFNISNHEFPSNGSTFNLDTPCIKWQQPQHVLFQLANICFCVSYLAPNGKVGVLFMHALLILGFLLFSTWAWNVICAPDVFSWNFCFMLLNMGQTLYLSYDMRKVKFPPELEDIYQSMFYPLQVSRLLFKKLVSVEYAQMMSLHAGEAYAMQNLTRTDRLGLLITGKVNVITDNHFLHHINAKEFLDSPEFEACKAGVEEKFNVSIIAASPCRYIFWQRQHLEYLLIKEAYLANVLSLLLSRDITTKLYAMNDKIVTEKGSHLDIRLPSITGSMTSHPTTQDGGDPRSPYRGGNKSPRFNSISYQTTDMYRDCDGDDSVFDSKERFVGPVPAVNSIPVHKAPISE